jgi:predicted RNase H-like HicB family nuclease
LKRLKETIRHIPRICRDALQQERPREETEKNMHEAIEMHVRGLIEDKLPVPESTSFAEYVAVP